MYGIDYHGDDYAVSPHNSARMLELVESGRLDSMSIIPNMSYYRECMDLLKKRWNSFDRKPLLSIHLNLIDGFSLSGLKNPLLCNEKGILCAGWGSLFLHSCLPGRKRAALREDIRTEFRAQIKRVYDDLPDGTSLRLDSHVHTHMIPVVFDAMILALRDLNLLHRTEYIRLSNEPILPFIRTAGVRFTFPAVNIAKNLALRLLSARVERRLKALKLEPCILWGLCLSGRMDKKRIDLLAPEMLRIAKKKNSRLEVLCHPGIVLKEEETAEYGADDMKAFFSENRNTEYDAVRFRAI